MSISKVGTYAFYNHPNLERTVVSAPTIEANAFQNANKLEVVDLTNTGANTIAANAFASCSKLRHLVVRGTTRSTLSATSALVSTAINRGNGGIYVPSDLLDSYKSATNWSTYANNIYPIGEYPRDNFDTIEDSWSTILTNSDYATDYAVKDTKTMELTDGTKIKLALAAFDVDDKSDGSGKAKITWLCHMIYFRRRFGNSGDTWENSEIRDYINTMILPLIPQEIKTHMVSVKKDSVNDMLWIPSYSEIFGIYYDLYGSNSTFATPGRIKYLDRDIDNQFKVGMTSAWSLRTKVNTTTGLYIVTDDGSVSQYGTVTAGAGVVFGFCTD